MARRIIKNGTVVSLDPEVGQFDDADVLIEDGEIVDIGPGLASSNAEVIDAENHIVLPGFVDSHLHFWQTQVRGIAGDWSLMGDYFQHMLGNIAGLYGPEDMYLGNLFGALEKLHTGTTTALDWSHAINTPENAERAVDGLQDAGIRATYAYGPPGNDAETWWFNSDVGHPEEDVRALYEEKIKDDDLLTLGLALRGPDFTTEEVARSDLELARELGVVATIHMGAALWPSSVYGDDYQGFGAIHDMLGPDVNVAHGNHFSQEDVDHAIEQGVSFSVTPEVEMQMGHGIPATGKVLAAGGRPTWGVDVCSNVNGDMATQMRIGLQVQRMFDNQEILEGDAEVTEVSLTCREALEFATIEGAKALQMDDEIGTLTPGKRADIILVREDDFLTAPAHNPIETVVFQADASHIDTVLVDGQPVKEDGVLVNPKLQEEFGRFVESGRQLIDEAGIAS